MKLFNGFTKWYRKMVSPGDTTKKHDYILT